MDFNLRYKLNTCSLRFIYTFVITNSMNQTRSAEVHKTTSRVIRLAKVCFGLNFDKDYSQFPNNGTPTSYHGICQYMLRSHSQQIFCAPDAITICSHVLNAIGSESSIPQLRTLWSANPSMAIRSKFII